METINHICDNIKIASYSEIDFNDQLLQLLNEQTYSDIDSQLIEEELMLIRNMKQPFVYKHPFENKDTKRSELDVKRSFDSNRTIEENEIKDKKSIVLDNDSCYHIASSFFSIDKTNEFTINANKI